MDVVEVVRSRNVEYLEALGSSCHREFEVSTFPYSRPYKTSVETSGIASKASLAYFDNWGLISYSGDEMVLVEYDLGYSVSFSRRMQYPCLYTPLRLLRWFHTERREVLLPMNNRQTTKRSRHGCL